MSNNARLPISGSGEKSSTTSTATATATAKPNLLAVVTVLGASVLASYGILLPRVRPDRSVTALWFGIDGRLRNVYYASILFSAVCFLAAFGWVYTKGSEAFASAVTPAYVVMLLGAVGWSVALWWWGRQSRGSALHTLAVWLTVAALVATSAGAGMLVYTMCGGGGGGSGRRAVGTAASPAAPPWWVCASVWYFLFHVLVMDNVGWSYAFVTHSNFKLF
jgi:hypothetical protein